MMLKNYFYTIKYLKLSQIYYRILKRFSHPKAVKLCGNRANPNDNWVSIELYEKKLFDNGEACFLNKNASLENATIWNDSTFEKLWLYNLHYFDDLNAKGSEQRNELHCQLINRWISENPAPVGNGWEPYPISLRVVNWVKKFLSGIEPSQAMLDSLATQANFLSQDLERHLLGNHLFVNAKALVFAGTYLDGQQARRWLRLGLDIYHRELKEQVLSDGGNFELTPMYHAIMLVDLLDLLNLWATYPNKIDRSTVVSTQEIAIKMLNWLDKMSHTDGDISFFNDSAIGIAPKNSVIFEYAKRLDLDNNCVEGLSAKPKTMNLYDLNTSGYVVVSSNEYKLIADLADVGPSYQPGHAHADSLSFEMSLGNGRLFVNSGTSVYGLSKERLRQRKTCAHNTLSIDGLDSSEVWSGFRVARRAKIINREVQANETGAKNFSAAYQGFFKRGNVCEHKRAWEIYESEIHIIDTLKGQFELAQAFLHLHPNVEILSQQENILTLKQGEYQVLLKTVGSIISIENSTWHPEFGKSIPNKRLVLSLLSNKQELTISWAKVVS